MNRTYCRLHLLDIMCWPPSIFTQFRLPFYQFPAFLNARTACVILSLFSIPFCDGIVLLSLESEQFVHFYPPYRRIFSLWNAETPTYHVLEHIQTYHLFMLYNCSLPFPVWSAFWNQTRPAWLQRGLVFAIRFHLTRYLWGVSLHVDETEGSFQELVSRQWRKQASTIHLVIWKRNQCLHP